MTNYEMGRRLEYRVRNLFRKSGFFVVRAAQSKPIDLVCLRKGESVLVECKAGSSYLSGFRKRELVALGERSGATVVLARRKNRKIELTNLHTGERFEPDGTPDSMSR